MPLISCFCRYVKSSSPRLNVVVLVGAVMSLPYSVIDGIITSALRYNLRDPYATIICQVNFVQCVYLIFLMFAYIASYIQ